MLILVMLRGRHRGLPIAIDRAVLLPGKGLMERMDRELKGPRGHQAVSGGRDLKKDKKTTKNEINRDRETASERGSGNNEASLV